MNKINAGSGSLKMSLESDCLDDSFIMKILGEPVYRAWAIGHGEPMERDFVKVWREFDDYDDEQLWCDTVTGSLYKQDFTCLSSDRLRIESEPEKTGKKARKYKSVPTRHVGITIRPAF